MPPFLTRVRLQNYRSIEACDVALGALTFLVGPNGAGKSNFLDALRLTADGLRTSLEHAMRERGGIGEVRRRSGGHPTHFGIRLDFSLDEASSGHYAFKVGAQRGGAYVVQQEECRVGEAFYEVQDGKAIRTTSGVAPPASPDRLYLVNAAGLPEFRPAYDALSRMLFFNPVPDVIRRPQPPDPGDLLLRDGRNLASAFERLLRDSPGATERIQQYLGQVVPGVQGAQVDRALGLETLEFRQDVGQRQLRGFKALSMSDGTLRAFGALVALFWPGSRFIALEEPEMALHPAAAGVLMDALVEASTQRQVVVTTHSADLLDDEGIGTSHLLAVVLDRGQTRIGAIDETGRHALREHLYTAGELLRMEQLAPEQAVPAPGQLEIFSKDRS